MKSSDLNTHPATVARKAELKAEQDKSMNFQAFDLIFFLGENFFGDENFQNMFVYQPTLNMLRVKTRALNMKLIRNQKRVYSSKLTL